MSETTFWKNAETNPPTSEGRYLVGFKSGKWGISDYYNSNLGWVWTHKSVQYWMEVPEFPNESPTSAEWLSKADSVSLDEAQKRIDSWLE